MPPGERPHVVGEHGARRAQNWLISTTRVSVPWTAYDDPTTIPDALRIVHPDGSPHHFDLAGYFLDGDLKGSQFLAEVKHYQTAGHQSEHYRDYLLNCYFAATSSHRNFHFMWITWHPFGTLSRWSQLCAPDSIMDALRQYNSVHSTAYGDLDTCRYLSDRLWLILLAERQERYLVPSPRTIANAQAQHIHSTLQMQHRLR